MFGRRFESAQLHYIHPAEMNMVRKAFALVFLLLALSSHAKNGLEFTSRDGRYSADFGFRIQSLVSADFGENFSLTGTQAQIKRLRLRINGHAFSPKIEYSLQLGFSGYDTSPLPDGKMNLIRDAMIYYLPDDCWKIGFGQTNIRASRAQLNSSSSLEFVDRSIVNSEFTVDRDFGLFCEYNYGDTDRFAFSASASATLGEGRNWVASSTSGFAYTARIELYPNGRFHAKGNYSESDIYSEDTPKIMIAGAYSFNDNALRVQGQKGALFTHGTTKDLGSYYVDLVLKYRGFAFVADFMGRHCSDPFFTGEDYSREAVFTGQGLNLQTSYVFDSKWGIALRNSTLFADQETATEFGRWNQTTLGVTRYISSHRIKLQVDASYNHTTDAPAGIATDASGKWSVRFQVELGL